MEALICRRLPVDHLGHGHARVAHRRPCRRGPARLAVRVALHGVVRPVLVDADEGLRSRRVAVPRYQAAAWARLGRSNQCMSPRTASIVATLEEPLDTTAHDAVPAEAIDGYAREMIEGCIASTRAALEATFATHALTSGLPEPFLRALEARVLSAEITYRLPALPQADEMHCARCLNRFAGTAQRSHPNERYARTIYCRTCVDLCHEGGDGHRCEICAPQVAP